MEPEDKELNCVDCGNSFLWGKGEQKFMQKCLEEKTVAPNGSIVKEIIAPKRCTECRAIRKKNYENHNNNIKKII